MDYNHIKNFLDKFKNILFEKEEKIKLISLAIKKNTQIEIEDKNIKISGNVIQIKSSPLVKGEILMKKENILKDLSSVSGSIYKEIR
ncbi:hypothetical protein HXX01_00095 [Candidatus Nomurabacteria bacterium]|nr:hypothetical protein [Candidatus Nomurabacteria bacterium]